MSSHHFVREDQEPALLIFDYVPARDSGTLDQLLEWSPKVFAPAPVSEVLLSSGYKVDTILVTRPEDTSLAIDLQDRQGHITVHTIPSANEVIPHLNVTDINILNAPSHQVPRLCNQSMKGAVAFYWQEGKATFIPEGLYSKWLPGGTRLEILGMAGGHHPNQTDNLIYLSETQKFLPDSRAFEVAKDGRVRVVSDKGMVVFERSC